MPDEPRAVVSPADGRIVVVGRAQDPYLKREALKISVFMNVFNVHSNRAPVDGAVKERWYFPGAFVNAALDKASLENERNALWLRTRDGGADVTCVQIAGLIARRILCYVDAGAELVRGQRFGFIRFGSRVDVYLPLDAEPKAAIGDKVYAARNGARMADGFEDEPRSSGRARAAGGAATARGIYLLPNLFTTGVLFCRLLRHRAGDERPLRDRPRSRSSSPWCSTAWTGAWRAGPTRRASSARNTTRSPTWWRSAPRRR